MVTGGTFNGTTTGIYTVTFNSGVPSQIRANCPATAPDAPTKRGYIFNGWLNGGTPYDFTQNVTQNIYLTADWTPKSYTVKFDTNGGTTIADKILTWDDMVLEGVSDPTKPGYDFAGWTFDGGNVLTRTTYANLAADDTVTSITLTAQWTLHLYTVTLDANGGTFDASGSTVAQDTMQVTYGGNFDQMPIPRYKGYFSVAGMMNSGAAGNTAMKTAVARTHMTKRRTVPCMPCGRRHPFARSPSIRTAAH